MDLLNSSRTFPEVYANVVFGANIWLWGFLGIIQAEPQCRFTIVRLCISGLHFVAGTLFLMRCPVREHGTANQILRALPSVVISGFIFAQTPPPNQWPAYASLTFLIGALFSTVALLALGRSFAILPAIRQIRTSGVYSFVRHPVYLGELILVASCMFASPTMQTVSILVLSLGLIIVRIQAEESLLERDAGYGNYRRQVRWRIMPLIW